MRWTSKIVPEWKDRLEMFSRPLEIEHYRQYLLLRTDNSQKAVVECPCILEELQYLGTNVKKLNLRKFRVSYEGLYLAFLEL